MKKSPVGSWRSFFNLGKSSSLAKRKLQRNPSEPSEMKAIALAGEQTSDASQQGNLGCPGFPFTFLVFIHISLWFFACFDKSFLECVV